MYLTSIAGKVNCVGERSLIVWVLGYFFEDRGGESCNKVTLVEGLRIPMRGYELIGSIMSLIDI